MSKDAEHLQIVCLASALQVGDAATGDLLLARSHDEVIKVLAGTRFERGAELVSQALWSSVLMSDTDISALASHIQKLDAGPRTLKTYRLQQQEEDTMP